MDWERLERKHFLEHSAWMLLEISFCLVPQSWWRWPESSFHDKTMRINNANIEWSLCCLLLEPLLHALGPATPALNPLCFCRVISLALTMMLQIIARVYGKLWIMIPPSHSALLGGFSVDDVFPSTKTSNFFLQRRRCCCFSSTRLSLLKGTRDAETNFQTIRNRRKKKFLIIFLLLSTSRINMAEYMISRFSRCLLGSFCKFRHSLGWIKNSSRVHFWRS